MIRQRCQFNSSATQCKTMFRSRRKHALCRECHKINFGVSREIKRIKKVKLIKTKEKVETASKGKRK